MPITLTAVGTVLTATIVDDNFRELERLLVSRLEQNDFAGLFSRYHILRYTGHRIASATSFANMAFDALLHSQTKFDLTIRYGIDESPISGVPDAIQAFELLGFPGKSFYFDFQEEGYDINDITAAGLTGFPPTGWPYGRFPSNACFSPWLTIPGAALKVWADETCVAVVSASAFGSLNFTQIGALSTDAPTFSAVVFEGYHFYHTTDNMNARFFFPQRLALIVDTNPIVHDDEFVNANPNIDGNRCSFQFIEQRAFYAGQRQMFKLAGEVALNGRRYYNFSFKYKYGGIFGYAETNGENNLWHSEFQDPGYPSMDVFVLNPEWLDSVRGWLSGWSTIDVSADLESVLAQSINTFNQVRPYVCSWESGAIHVEFHYGRNSAYTTDYDHAEHDEVPT